jgi:DNA-directed RNA polymerase subunit beta'
MMSDVLRRSRNPDSNDYYEGVKDSISQLFPIEYNGKKLDVSDIDFKHKELPPFDMLHNFKLNKSTLTIPVTGKLTLSENGKVLDSKTVRLANVPQYLMSNSTTLHHGTFLINGNDYTFPIQIRLNPGVYTHYKENGELETHFNKRKGWTLRVYLDKDTRRFMLFVGNHNINLYSVLKALGAPDQAIEKAWGKDLYNINSHVNTKNELDKFENLIEEKTKLTSPIDIKAWFSSMDVGDANTLTSSSTIGTAVPKEITPSTGGVTWQVLLASSERILDVLNGKSEADDRNDIKFKTVHNIATYAKERLSIPEVKNKINRKYKMLMAKSDKISDIHTSAIIGKPFNALFTGTSLSNLASQNNPTAIYTNLSKATLMHEGGITSSYMVSPSARAVHPSHFGIFDPVFTPESEDIGVVHQLTDGTYIDKDTNKLYVKVIDIKTGKETAILASEFSTIPIMFHDAKPKNGLVQAIKHGQIVELPISQLKYKLLPAEDIFSITSNLIPFLGATSALRAMMGSKMMTQALPLINREIPKVSNFDDKGRAYDARVGKDFSVNSPIEGKVTAISENAITIHPPSGKPVQVSLPHFLPLNGDSYLTADTNVKVGDVVKKGDVLADSNTTKNGVLALGTNLRTAYIPIDGNTFEDATVISESASKKLTSGRLKTFELEYDSNVILNKAQFSSIFPSALTLSNAQKLDKNGIIRKGETLSYNDAMIVAFKPHEQSQRDLKLKAFTKRNLIKYDNISLIWPYENEGKVTDVAVLPREIRVFVYMEEPTKVGDKITTRYGSKMLIGKVIPDDQMPKTEDGKHVELMFNPISVINRTIPSLLLELAASKLKGYKPKNFSDTNYIDSITKAAKEQNIPLNETIHYKGHVIKNVPVGENYVFKLGHIANDKISARYKDGYDSNMSPLSGGTTGAKSMDLLTVYSLLAANAKANLNEMGTYKSEKNDDFWHAIEFGQTPPPPKALFSSQKFEALLKNAGINMVKDGTKYRLTPITDKITEHLSNGEIKSPKIIFSDLSPEPGGLYDPKITGGLDGKNWAHIDLVEPIPNPILRPILTKVLNLSNVQYQGLLDHKLSINGKTGAKAFKELLSKVDMNYLPVPTDKKLALSQLDAINKHNRFIAGLKETGIKPEELLIKKIPVLPPVFRPIGVLPEGKILQSDLTYLYRDILMRNDILKRLPTNIPEDTKQKLYSNLSNSVEALYGLTDPVGNYFGLHKPKGILDLLATSPPDESFFRKKMLSKEQNLVGRSVIIPNPDLHPDQIGLPLPIASSIFRPFVMQKLVQTGMHPLTASDNITKQTPIFKKTLENVMKERTVLLNRAPSLHKWNITAYKPHLTEGDAIKTAPLTVAMFGGDYDGDAVTLHTPISDAAVKESYNLLPSAAFYHPGKDFTWLTPTNESALGIYKASSDGKNVNKKYSTFNDAMSAWKKSDININDRVTIEGKSTSLGKLWLKKEVPNYKNQILDKQGLKDLLKVELMSNSDKGINIVMKLKELGDTVAMHMPITLQDMAPLSIGGKPTHFDPQAMLRYSKIADEALRGNSGVIGDFAKSHAIKGINQLRQIIAGPVSVEDNTGQVFKYPLTTGYSSGLNLPQYWGSTFGARKGAVDRKIKVSEPGVIANELLNLAQDYTISEKDCGTHKGISMSTSSNDILDYVPVEDVIIKGKTIVNRNQILTPHIIEDLKKYVHELIVRSPLTCEAREGVCSICHGPEGGKFLQVGDYVGIRNAQFMAEPATQLTLASFHTQGVIGANTFNKGLTKLKNILGMQPDFLGRAQISLDTGKVQDIIKRPEGSTEVHIDNKMYLLPPGNEPLVKKGQHITKGTMLNNGMVSPLDIYTIKGLLPARQYIADEMKKTYSDSGIFVRKRVFDTIAKALTNRARVIEPGDAINKYPGDYITASYADNFNKTPIVIDVKKVKNHIDPHTGSPIDLTKIKTDKVTVLPKPIVYEPLLKSLESTALAKEDWIARLSFRHLKNTIQEGVIRNWVSDLSGNNPIPQYAFGVPLHTNKEEKGNHDSN